MKGQKLKFCPIEPSKAPEKLRTRKTENSIIGLALTRSATMNPIRLKTDKPMMLNAAGLPKPSTGPWLQSARNVFDFANADGRYDDLKEYLEAEQRYKPKKSKQ